MPAIEIRFLAGRCHATPWARHVNEGDVEWPPSPWRLVRALLATGFARLGWSAVPAPARSLVEALSERVPEFLLPPGSAAHTRHFMPDYRGGRDKVLDAFVDVGRDAVLGVEWAAELGEEEIDQLDALLARLSYLGRAEAWVEARRVDRLLDGLVRCAMADVAPGPRYERVPLLAPVPTNQYRSWRTQCVGAEVDRELARKRAAAEAKGRRPPAKLSPADVRRVEAGFPETLLDALRIDTSTLQRDGWSQPPGSQWVSYWRDERVLAPSPAIHARKRVSVELPDTAVLAIASDTKNGERLPRFTDTVLRMELLHEALVSRCSEANGGAPSPCLIGKDRGQPIQGHRHASLVPLNLEGSSPPRIDHVLVHAPMGLDEGAQEALRKTRLIYSAQMRFFVSLVGLGTRDELSRMVDLVGAARTWMSSTPFVAPRHLKPRGRNTLLGQVLAELESRGRHRPELVEVELAGGHWVRLDQAIDTDARPAARWRHFRRARLERARRPPSTDAFGLRLTFRDPEPGPILLGYASHFGLGAFAPCPAV